MLFFFCQLLAKRFTGLRRSRKRLYCVLSKNKFIEKLRPNIQLLYNLDTKNSTGLVGCIEEVAHNAICVYWTPMESPAKVVL